MQWAALTPFIPALLAICGVVVGAVISAAASRWLENVKARTAHELEAVKAKAARELDEAKANAAAELEAHKASASRRLEEQKAAWVRISANVTAHFGHRDRRSAGAF